MALHAVLSNRLRSSLSTLGIAIGVSAVIFLLAVGAGARTSITGRINRLGTNLLTISPVADPASTGQARLGTQSSFHQLTEKDVAALQNRGQVPDVRLVAPVVSASSVNATYGNAEYQPGRFLGTTPSYAQIANYAVAQGRFFTEADGGRRSRVVVLGQTAARKLFGGTSPLAKSVKFNDALFEVIGVLQPKGSSGPGGDQDDIALAPYQAVQDSVVGNSATFDNVSVSAVSQGRIAPAQSEIESALRSTHELAPGSELDFEVRSNSSILSTATEVTKILTLLLGAVAAISLVVGGIGVMNIMLVTVTERTREIGIRKAIGARRANIVSQFVLEAIFLTGLGGLAGVLIGVIGTQFSIAGFQPVLQPYSIVLGLVVSVATGLVFGIYPANRAALLQPIDALRHE
jgi:putative ABC transport system permease protein